MIRKIMFKAGQVLRKMGINLRAEKHPAVLNMKKTIKRIGSINLKIEVYPDGSWTAESTNIDGIITGGKDAKERNLIIRDAIFTYFDIPAYLCDDNLLRESNEPVTVTQRVWATR